MINSLDGIIPGDFYADEQGGIWFVESMCELPTITLRRVRGDETRGGAIGCLNLSGFRKAKFVIEGTDAFDPPIPGEFSAAMDKAVAAGAFSPAPLSPFQNDLDPESVPREPGWADINAMAARAAGISPAGGGGQ